MAQKQDYMEVMREKIWQKVEKSEIVDTIFIESNAAHIFKTSKNEWFIYPHLPNSMGLSTKNEILLNEWIRNKKFPVSKSDDFFDINRDIIINLNDDFETIKRLIEKKIGTEIVYNVECFKAISTAINKNNNLKIDDTKYLIGLLLGHIIRTKYNLKWDFYYEYTLNPYLVPILKKGAFPYPIWIEIDREFYYKKVSIERCFNRILELEGFVK